MTKRYFTLFAGMLKADEITTPVETRWYAAQCFMSLAAAVNYRFDRDKFLKAAGLTGWPKIDEQ